jgi:hypothetical protein
MLADALKSLNPDHALETISTTFQSTSAVAKQQQQTHQRGPLIEKLSAKPMFLKDLAKNLVPNEANADEEAIQGGESLEAKNDRLLTRISATRCYKKTIKQNFL